MTRRQSRVINTHESHSTNWIFAQRFRFHGFHFCSILKHTRINKQYKVPWILFTRAWNTKYWMWIWVEIIAQATISLRKNWFYWLYSSVYNSNLGWKSVRFVCNRKDLVSDSFDNLGLYIIVCKWIWDRFSTIQTNQIICR